MHYASCILVQCTSTINHASGTLLHYISTVHCKASIGALPPWTVYLGKMHSNNESCIVHICSLDFYYALCSFLGCTSFLNYAPCSFKWCVLLCKVHLHILQFHYARCTIHLGLVQFHYAPCIVQLVTMHFLHEIWTMHLGIMHSYFLVYTSILCTSTMHLITVDFHCPQCE